MQCTFCTAAVYTYLNHYMVLISEIEGSSTFSLSSIFSNHPLVSHPHAMASVSKMSESLPFFEIDGMAKICACTTSSGAKVEPQSIRTHQKYSLDVTSE